MLIFSSLGSIRIILFDLKIEKYNLLKNAYIVAKDYKVHTETIYRILRNHNIKRQKNDRR